MSELGRWMRKHPWLTFFIVLLVVASVTGLVTGLIVGLNHSKNVTAAKVLQKEKFVTF